MLAEDQAALDMLRAAYKPAQIHEQGKVPLSPVTPYAIPSVSSGASGTYRNSGQHSSKSYRIAVQCIGKTKSEIAKVVDATDVAFLDQQVAIAGFDTTPCRAEITANVTRDPDGGGLLYCLLTYTFTAFPIATTEETP